MKFQILVTTMRQSDFSKVAQMNIQSDVLIANQADCCDYAKREFDGFVAEMITTPTRGLSKNRNIALAYADKDAEYVLFADDDLVFVDGYEKLIEDEFKNHPEAQAIKFNLNNLSKTRKISMKRIERFQKATRRNVTSSGVCALAARKDVLIKYNFHFNEYFGAGTENYCGEDTIFLQGLVNRKIGFYLSPVAIAGIDQTESCWFEGHTEKYFLTTGKIFAAIYPRLAKLLAIRSAYKFAKRKNCDLKFAQILRCYWRGIDEYLKRR